MGTGAEIAIYAAVASAAVGTAASIQNAQDQKRAQAAALAQQKRAAEEQEKLAEATLIASQKKSADTTAILASQAKTGGIASTMLSGSFGASTGTLGKSSLLGG